MVLTAWKGPRQVSRLPPLTAVAGAAGVWREAKRGCVGACASGVHSHCISPSETAGYFHENKISSKYSGEGGKNGNICFLFPTVSQLAVKKAPLRCSVSILFYH